MGCPNTPFAEVQRAYPERNPALLILMWLLKDLINSSWGAQTPKDVPLCRGTKGLPTEKSCVAHCLLLLLQPQPMSHYQNETMHYRKQYKGNHAIIEVGRHLYIDHLHRLCFCGTFCPSMVGYKHHFGRKMFHYQLAVI
jgi:hypothetical protein